MSSSPYSKFYIDILQNLKTYQKPIKNKGLNEVLYLNDSVVSDSEKDISSLESTKELVKQ